MDAKIFSKSSKIIEQLLLEKTLHINKILDKGQRFNIQNADFNSEYSDFEVRFREDNFILPLLNAKKKVMAGMINPF